MSKPICMQCGCDLDCYEPERYARCDSCFDQLSKRSDTFTLAADVLIRVRYFPGFAADLTNWYSAFYVDGTIIQTINWYSPVHNGDRQSKLKSHFDSTKLTQVNKLLSSIDLACLSEFKRWMSVDDAPFVHIHAPQHNLHVTVDQIWIENDRIPDDAKAGFKQFQAAWKLIDSLSPYTLAEHRNATHTN
ncbi:hypothetical protein [Calycomorphotria hydatis]|uniref:Uncharacterized protein n=1 Tax=Calycomorphotria hydatis TaxID=2528027 RepID=A0A517T997_9PLAN|nr:hypothetical protein [Calycomorphotria hydatis]QDT64951.1 hypothetical protein V22_21960 [Calycomorphotria hydatis]